MRNPVGWFDLPVNDLARAVKFYQAVFGYEFELSEVDGYEMAMFPMTNGSSGASGALVKGDVYVPSTNGVIIYFHVENIAAKLAIITQLDGEILYPEKSIGEWGSIAEFKDSEGNRVALHAD
jgi:uncharacterized protein